MIRIIIETEDPSDLRKIIDSFALKHHCNHVSAPDLIKTARRLDKNIEEAKPAPFRTGVITTTTVSPTAITPQTSQEMTCTGIITPAKPTADKLSSTTEHPEPAKQKKQRGGNLSAYQTKPAEPQTSVKAPVCVDVWTDEELNLLKTCSTHKDAQFVYHSHFGDARNDNAIYQRWLRLSKAGETFAVGDSVRLDWFGEKDTGKIVSFTDARQCANVSVNGNSATYQVGIDKLEKVNAE